MEDKFSSVYFKCKICQVHFKLGMKFETLNIVNEVGRNYTICHGRDIKWLKNDKQRCKTICNDEECKSMMQKVCTFCSSDYFYMCLLREIK